MLLFPQEESQTDREFTIGAFFSRNPNTEIFKSFEKSGMNTVVWRADENTRKYISNYNVIANNADRKEDWIQHYATGFYAKWEAEENQKNKDAVGIKHKCGNQAIWKSKLCWSSDGYTAKSCSLLYGPHYKQEKRYKRWMYGCRDCIDYTVNYRMALDFDPTVNRNEAVCRIKVVHRYARLLGSKFDLIDEVLTQKLLKVSDFPADGSFKNFELPSYRYNLKFTNPSVDKYTYKDIFGDNGIQYQVEWLRSDKGCTLYIDYIEVYDNEGKYFNIENSLRNTEAVRNIKSHVNQYSDWQNIIYWFANDEPSAIDAYTPMRFVDSLVRSEGGAPIITEFYPDWRITVNGDSQLVRYFNMANPQKLMIDIYPFAPTENPPISSRLESLRQLFTIAHDLQPDFWYVGQGFGIRNQNGNWETWKYPDSTELKSTIMLALAHGVKGLLFWNYDSYRSGSNFVEGIVDRNLKPTELWYLIKNNFVSRLKGKLGKTLLGLNYTGKYINIGNDLNISSTSNKYDYLSIEKTGNQYRWHAGLFERNDQTDNKYFLLVNLNVNSGAVAELEIDNDTKYQNLSFRNVERKVPESNKTIGYNSSIKTNISVPAGDGYLFQVAPVVKFGGSLIYDETINESCSLNGVVTIKNNATLTINSDYFVYGNIIVEDGDIEYGEKGKIHYINGDKMKIKDTEEISK
jgi:hypothetical protein